MSFSAGTFSINSTGQPVVTGTTISSSVFNALTADLATGLTTCVLKDGSQTITANIPMASFKFTGLGAGSASGDSVRYEQIIGVVTTAGDIVYATAAGTFARLAIGAAGSMLAVNAGATAPAYQAMATQADQETATSVLAPVTPGRQHYHPSAPKCWSYFTTDGTQNASYNMASITDNGTGDWSPVIATDFSSAAYAVFVTVRNDGSGTAATTLTATCQDTIAAGQINLFCRRVSDGALSDPGAMFVGACGDQ